MEQNSNPFVQEIEEMLKLPRQNGELIFNTPWESRIFGMAVLLFQKGLYPWKEFNHAFVKEIGEFEQNNPGTDVESHYYRLWVRAFEKVLLDKNMMTEELLETRTNEFMSGKRNHVC